MEREAERDLDFCYQYRGPQTFVFMGFYFQVSVNSYEAIFCPIEMYS